MPDTIPDDVVTTTETITPAVAREWLGWNTRNRPLKRTKIETYKRDMTAGRWAVTGESIKFGTNGYLLDGQNRLVAIIESGATIRSTVARGVEIPAQDVMDSGAARSAADALHMAGVKDAGKITAAARLAMAVEEIGYADNKRKYSNAEVQAWVLDHLDITEAPTLLGRDGRMIPLPPSVRVYIAYRFAQVDTAAAAKFLSQLATGVGMSPDSPILALRRRLTGDYGSERRITIDEQILAVFRTWNAWREGRPLGKVQVTRRPEAQSRALPPLV